MNENPIITEVSIWDQYETVLQEYENISEFRDGIGIWPAPLRRIGDSIQVNGIKRTITNFYLGVNESDKLPTNTQLVIEVE